MVGTYTEITVEDERTGCVGYLVVEASDRPISFGGTRVDSSVTLSTVAQLAENMTLKLAGHGAPVGGAKAGVRASPDDPRLGHFLARFAEGCRRELSTRTVLGKDMGAKQWMLDQIYAQLGRPQLGIAKQQSDGHCPDRLSDLAGYIPHMTGQGVFWSIVQALHRPVHGARVLIQGSGVVGTGVAWHLAQAGATIVGISDRDTAVHAKGGLDVRALWGPRDGSGAIPEPVLAGQCAVDRDALLAQDADVLVLAAGSHLVDGSLAALIQAPLVIEAANLALAPDALSVLRRRSVRVVPDVVANSASAALVGHQIASGNTCDPTVLWANIECNIRENTDEVVRISAELGFDAKAAVQHLLTSRSRDRGADGRAMPCA